MLKIVFWVIIAVCVGVYFRRKGPEIRNKTLSVIITGIGILLESPVIPSITIYYAWETYKSSSWFWAIALTIISIFFFMLMLGTLPIEEYRKNVDAFYRIICILGIIPYLFVVSAFDTKLDQFVQETKARIQEQIDLEEEYNSKIVTTMENEVIISEEIRGPLTYFCNIPVQNVSGHIKGSGIFGGGGGDISTTDNLVYWYLQGEEGVCDNAPAKSSRMIPLQESEEPYLRIVTYCNREKTVNGNNGEVSYNVTDEWTEYEFYLPEEIVKGQFNN